ncbi:MAG: S41 family peptidase [Gemmatimonadales bacterium]
MIRHPGLLALGASLLLTACAHRPAAPFDRATGALSFEAAWRIVHETHFDTTFNGVDWVALGDSLRPMAERARSRDALRGVIRAMLDRLGESHFTLIPREVADSLDPSGGAVARGSTGLDVRLIAEQLLVTGVDSGSAAARAGVRPGWVVVVAGHDSVAALLRRARERPGRYRIETALWSAGHARLSPPLDSAVEVAFLDGADRPSRLRLVSQAERSEPIKYGNLPTFFVRFLHRRVDAPGGGCVGVIAFTGWLAPVMRQLDAAVDADRGCVGMVLDLRGNTGGLGAMVAGVAGHFLDRPDTLGLMRTRQTTLAFIANPRRVTADARPVRPFAGPLAVLVDEGSASASEVFAAGMQALGRARVFGRTSMGAVLGASFDRLPDGDVLYHALGTVTAHGGRALEGRGVIPDDSVTATRADLLAGKDPVLDAAVGWIAGQSHGGRR